MVPLLAATAALALCLEQLLIAPVVALANNGDFNRLLALIGLRSTGPSFAIPYAWLHYHVGHTHAPGGPYLTSYLALTGLLGSIAHRLPGGALDSRVLAAVLAVLLAIGLYLLVKAIPGQAARVAAGAILVVGLCDARLVAYLDSWYDEPWSLLMLVAVTASLVRNRGARTIPGRRLAVFIVIAALLITTNTQDAVLVVPVIAAIAVLARHPGRSLTTRLRPALLPFLALVAVAVGFFAAQSPVYASESRYNLIFDDLLLHVQHPAATLEDLGLPASMKADAGMNAYQPGSGYRSAAFTRFDASDPTATLALYYAAHPAVAAGELARGIRAGWQADLPYLGYRTKSSGAPRWASGCGPCLYSNLTAAGTPVGVPLTIALYCASLLLAARARRSSHPGTADALVFLCAISATALIAAVFGEGHYEETKHLYLFYSSNLLLLALAVAVASHLTASQLCPLPKVRRALGRPAGGLPTCPPQGSGPMDTRSRQTPRASSPGGR